MGVLLLSSDLATSSRIEGVANRLGLPFHSAPTADGAIAHVPEHPATLVLIDLSTPALDVVALVNRLKTAGDASKIFAFGPHVHEPLLAAARGAGCDQVFSRGQFFAQLHTVLTRALG